MKKALSFILVPILIFSCYPYEQIISYKDNYKNERTIFIEFEMLAEGTEINIGLFNLSEDCILKFEKVFDLENDSLKTVKLYISTTLESDKILSDPVFFDLDNKHFKFNYEKINSIYYTTTEEEKVDSVTTRTIEKRKKGIQNSVTLSVEFLYKIGMTHSLAIRIYLDQIPYDIVFTYSELKKLKDFINAE